MDTETRDQRLSFTRDNYILLNGKRTATYVREGSYRNTPDDRLGRWYLGSDGYGFRPFGKGHATRREAAEEWLVQWYPYGR